MCIASLGIGMSERQRRKGDISQTEKIKRLASILTELKTNHNSAEQRLAREGVPYFRFNPTTEQDDIGLDEYKQLDALEMHTKNFFAREYVAADIKKVCADPTWSKHSGGRV